MLSFRQLRDGAALPHRASYGGGDELQTPVETLVDWRLRGLGDLTAACVAGGGERMVLAPRDSTEGERVDSRRHPF